MTDLKADIELPSGIAAQLRKMQGDYLTRRAALVARLDDVTSRHREVYRIIGNPVITPKEKAEALAKIEEFNREIDQLLAEIEAMDRATR